MRTPRWQFRIRSVLILIALVSAVLACAFEIIRYEQWRHQVRAIGTLGVNRSNEVALLWDHRATYYLGPIPIGPYPTVVFFGLVLGGVIVAMVLRRLRMLRRQDGKTDSRAHG
jgi:uncharacterized integral membrane protein